MLCGGGCSTIRSWSMDQLYTARLLDHHHNPATTKPVIGFAAAAAAVADNDSSDSDDRPVTTGGRRPVVAGKCPVTGRQARQGSWPAAPRLVGKWASCSAQQINTRQNSTSTM